MNGRTGLYELFAYGMEFLNFVPQTKESLLVRFVEPARRLIPIAYYV
jgi:hypothetical protein